MAECSPGILEDLGLPLSTAEREFTVAVFHALKPALSTGFFGLAFIFVAFIFVVVVVRLFVCLFLLSIKICQRLSGQNAMIFPNGLP